MQTDKFISTWRMPAMRGLLVVAWSVIAGVAGPGRVTADDPPASTADEQAIHAAALEFVKAYNGKDAAAMAALFGPHARVEEFDGTVVEGREAIQAAFDIVFQAEPKAAISIAMDSIQLITPDVAVEKGSTEFFPDGETLTSRSQYFVVHRKQAGGWKMASVRSLDREVVSNYEQLRALEWMTGDWLDEGDGATVRLSCQWADDKNFLLQEFEIHDLAGVSLKGTQRIGWDPQAKLFRSWIFDNSGAFAQATWTPGDGEWVVKITGVSIDGQSASATRRLRPSGGDDIVVTTTDRHFGGESLPDATVTLVRQPVPPATAATK